jgi:hypothetical protein
MNIHEYTGKVFVSVVSDRNRKVSLGSKML